MAELNRAAAEAMVQIGVNACTDVTGFGLLGHLLEMLTASRVQARVRLENVPFLEGAVELATSGMVPGGSKDTPEFTSARVKYAGEVSPVFRWLLNDAQTSGGLLIAVPDGRALSLLAALERKRGRKAFRIGEIVGAGDPGVVVV
jgi:selenide,water dikinase